MSEDIQESTRLNERIQWYEKYANHHMRCYERLKLVQILCGFSIPACSLLLQSAQEARVVNGVLGSAIAAIESYVQFRQFDKHWQRWRSTAEALKREKWLFLQEAGPYADPAAPRNPAAMLAERVEEIVSSEHRSWVELQTKNAGKDSKLPTATGGAQTA